MSVITGLEPKLIWQYFDEILQIPRPSKHEEKIIAYLEEFAVKFDLPLVKDASGNVLIKKAASAGFESKGTLILQSHMDMVCEKNEDTRHDFMTDPIIPVLDGDWISAKGTTLGADDGIGMATALALLAAKDIEHPPLECLFTVDEETGLSGAFGLSDKLLSGKTLINLDSEDEGEVFIGCAGGKDTIATFNFKTRPVPKGYYAFEIVVKGLRGGHSGDDIHKGYGNAVKIMNRFLWNASVDFGVKLHKFEGGNLRNAIPREAKSTVLVKEKYLVSFEKYFSNFCKMLFTEIKVVEPKLTFDLNKVDTPRYIIRKKEQAALLSSIYACPNGVIAMSADMPGLVETSTNLASIKFYEGNIIEVTTSQRSSVESAKEDICAMVSNAFRLGGALIHHSDGYPGWKPNKDSEILRVAEASYQKLFGEKPLVRAIHAGLECGLFLEKYPGMDMISIGPTLRNVHSPEEKIQISSVDKYWSYLLDILKTTK